MRKIFIGLLLAIMLVIPAESFAMTFHQPIEIGYIGWPHRENIVILKNAFQSSGKQVKNNESKMYELDGNIEGFAQFGNAEDAIFFHYTPKKEPLYGSKDKNNTFQIKAGLYGDTIYQIKNDYGIKIYIFVNSEPLEGFRNYTCLGKLKNGKFVKFFETDEIKRRYFGSSDWSNIRNGKLPYFKKIYCKNDMIIIEYERFQKQKAPIKEGEFRFKWDDKAQWFGIEQVVY